MGDILCIKSISPMPYFKKAQKSSILLIYSGADIILFLVSDQCTSPFHLSAKAQGRVHGGFVVFLMAHYTFVHVATAAFVKSKKGI